MLIVQPVLVPPLNTAALTRHPVTHPDTQGNFSPCNVFVVQVRVIRKVKVELN